MKFWQIAMFVLVQLMLCSGCSEDLVGTDAWDLDENEEFSAVVPDVGEQDASPPDPTDSGADGIPYVEDVDVDPDVDASMEGPSVAKVIVQSDPRVLLGQEKLNVTLSADSDRKLKVFYEGGTFSSDEENTPYFSLEGEVLVSDFE